MPAFNELENRLQSLSKLSFEAANSKVWGELSTLRKAMLESRNVLTRCITQLNSFCIFESYIRQVGIDTKTEEREISLLATKLKHEMKTERKDFDKQLISQKAAFESETSVERARIASTKAWWQERLDFVDSVSNPNSEPVTLSIEGTKLITTKNTLLKVPDSGLSAVFSEAHELLRNKDGEIVIDRNLEAFKEMLQYLRNNFKLPLDLQKKRLLRPELEFWKVPLIGEPQGVGSSTVDDQDQLWIDYQTSLSACPGRGDWIKSLTDRLFKADVAVAQEFERGIRRSFVVKDRHLTPISRSNNGRILKVGMLDDNKISGLGQIQHTDDSLYEEGWFQDDTLVDGWRMRKEAPALFRFLAPTFFEVVMDGTVVNRLRL